MVAAVCSVQQAVAFAATCMQELSSRGSQPHQPTCFAASRAYWMLESMNKSELPL
jgi:hypothetical protein